MHIAARRRGSVLVLVAAIAGIVIVLGVGLLQIGYQSRLRAVHTASALAARCAADAGIAHARLQMNNRLAAEQPWDNGTLPSATDVALAGSDAQFSYTVTGAAPSFLITATGFAGRVQRQAYARLGVGSAWDGIGVKETVDLKHGCIFAAIPPENIHDLTIRTNSINPAAILLKSGVTVPGDVVCGPGGDPDVVISGKSSSVIQGQTYAADELMQFPPVMEPAWPTKNMGNLNKSETIKESGVYSSITIPNGGTVDVEGPITLYVKGNLTLNNGSSLVVPAGSSLTLYLKGNLEDKNSAGIGNGTNLASSLKIYGLPTCTDITIKAKASLCCALYAPNADVVLHNSGDFCGAIVGESFEMKNSGKFIFDTRLAASGIDDPQTVFDLVRWWED
jgi:hypothetical protein